MNKKTKMPKTSRKHKKSKMVKKTKSIMHKKSRSKRNRSNKMKGGNNECDYLKVEGINLPGLKIDDQMALLNNSCKSSPSPTLSAGSHPHMST